MREHLRASASFLLGFTLLLGVAYPLAVWAVGRIAFPFAAAGSFVPPPGGEAKGGGEGRTAGSVLIGQKFSSPRSFHGRPSAAGDAGYDATASGGSNLAPTSRKLADGVKAAVARVRAEDPGGDTVPADTATASGSGLDPHISPSYALRQVPRVAAARGIPQSEVSALVGRRTEGRFLGVFGERRVNVLLLNLDLERLGVRGALVEPPRGTPPG